MYTRFISCLVAVMLAILLFSLPVVMTIGPSTASEPILDLIGRSEGTDRNYNETFGQGAFTAGAIDLTNMTLDEVDVLQTGMLAHPKNKWNSSACGRYQITRT